MEGEIIVVEYQLTGYRTYDFSDHSSQDVDSYSPEMCTIEKYAYVITSMMYNVAYAPYPRPGDFWKEHVVSAISYNPQSINVLTIGENYEFGEDIYIFCDPIRFRRIGVIRKGGDLMENLPRHPSGYHSWGNLGTGSANTCDIIWADITKRPLEKRNYPKGLNKLFRVIGMLPQEGSFAIPVNVVKRFVEED